MKRAWRIWKTFFVSSFARELEFRANFFAKVGQNVVWIFFFLMMLMVVYRNTDDVAGWTRGEALILAATCFLMNAINNAFFISLQEIPQHVRQGTLDFILTKPLDTQFWVSVRKFNFAQIGTLGAGIVLVIVGAILSGAHPTVLQWMVYPVMVLAALAIYYSLNLILMTMGIFWVRVENLWVLGESVMEIARYPLDIYSATLRRFFTFAVPLAFLATMPAKQLVRGFDPAMLALAIGWSVGAFLLSRFFWQFALTKYSSASS